MQIRIKTKLSLGLGFLFAVIILIASVGAIYIYTIADQSKKILKDNYESIQYTKLMMQKIDAVDTEINADFFESFEANLVLQENNITEIGEKEYTNEVRAAFNRLKKEGISEPGKIRLKKALYKITDLNLQAILRKHNQTQITADRVLTYIGLISGFCFVIVFAFIIKFPGYIANPIKELTESIKQISGKNYHQRLHFKSNDEFGELAEAFNVMAEELEQYENSNLAQIMFEKKRIETIINNMKDAIIGLDEKRIILFVNIQAVRLLNLKANEMIGKYAPDVAIHNDLMRLLISKESSPKPIKIVADDKESYFSRENISIVSEEKSIGEVILLKNITKFQELDLAKTNFIATISHELKTPLSSTNLGLKLLENDKTSSLTPTQKEIISDLKKDNSRLIRLVSELLDLSQVETGQINIQLTEVNVNELIEYSASTLKQQAKEKDIDIAIEIDPEIKNIKADKEKAVWVLVNLVSNAVRYSPQGGHVFISAQNSAAGKVIISVRDSGRGIPKEHQQKIFERFYKIPDHTDKQGSGLGLSISKEFMTVMNGDITLESSAGEGTVFRLYFNQV